MQGGDHRNHDQLRTVADYQHLVIKAKNGNIVQLPDIASIVQATRNSNTAAWFNLQPAVLLIVSKQANANVINTVDHIRELLPEIRRWIPAGIDISVLSDRTETIRASVHDMQATLATAAVLVMLVVFLFLRRAAPDDRRRRYRAVGARRYLRRDVAGRLLDRQSVADGLGGIGRVRGRRRDRDDRKHLQEP